MRNLHKGEHDSSNNLRTGKSNFMRLKNTDTDNKYQKMEDNDSGRKYPIPLGIGGSRIGSEISHLNDVEKTLDAIYKPHD